MGGTVKEGKVTDLLNTQIEDTYKSKEGFVQVPVRRGAQETSILGTLLYNMDGFICGGYVRWMCSPVPTPKPASDVDIYAYTPEAFEEIRQLFKDRKLKVRFENDNAITYDRVTDTSHIFFSLPPLQLIKPILQGAMVAVGSMQKVIENFDFTVIRAGLIDKDTALVDADFDHDELHSILRLKNIHCPISSNLRCMKYAAKGYWLPATQCIRLFSDWDSRDDDYRLKILDFLKKAESEGKLTREDIDEFEELARID
jgi:hypothetical protein